MGRALIEIGNARSKVSKLPLPVFKLLSHELSYKTGEEGPRQFMAADGSVKIRHWDGFTRLMTKQGVFPSGLIPRATRLLRKWGVGFELHDTRIEPMEGMPLWTFPEGFALRDYQLKACDAAMKLSRGVINSPPRSGKTIMMAELVRRIASKTVITAPTEAIASQTYQKLLELFGDGDWAGLGTCEHNFYLLTGGPPKSRSERADAARATVFVATAPTAARMSEHWWEGVKCLIVDERHHQAAKTYRKINDLAVNAYWRWGFTGTDFRSNPGEQVALEACLGRTVARYTISEMVERGVLVRGNVEWWPISPSDCIGIWSQKFSEGYKRGVVDCDPRNAMVVFAAGHYQQLGRKVLVLVQRIQHGQLLQKLIAGSRFVEAADGPEVREAVKQLDRGDIRCLIGSPVVGEGLDCPAADCLIYAKGYKARVTHFQDTFRVLTGGVGKPDAIIVDFADRHNRSLLNHTIERGRNYLAMGMSSTVHPSLPADITQLRLV